MSISPTSGPELPARIEIDLALMRGFVQPGPRYTTYPTADRFVEAFGPDAYESALARRNVGGITRPLTLYVHLPFCSTLCFFCGCDRVVTRDPGKGMDYFKYLAQEIALQANLLNGGNRESRKFRYAEVRPQRSTTVDS